MPELFEIERTVPRGEVAQVLAALADGVEAGAVTLEENGDTIEVDVPGELEYELELETEHEGDEIEVELEVELEWEAGPDRDADAPETERATAETDDTDGTDAEGGDEDAIEGDETASRVADEDRPDAGDEGDVGEGGAAGGVDGDRDEASLDPEDATDAPGEATALPVRPPALPDSAARFELYADRSGEWRWRLVHTNGNLIADSGESYARKVDARNGLESVRTNAPAADVIDVARED